MATNQQRREAERRRLQQQLEERRAREAARKRRTLIASIVGTVVAIALVIVIVVISVSGGSNNKTASGGNPSNSASTTPSSTTPSSTAATSTSPAPLPTKACAKPQGTKATLAGLTVTGATDLKHEPKLSGSSSSTPAALECADLVVGKGAAAKEGQSVTVEYVGAVYKTGKVFQSSWSSQAATFSLAQGQLITGFLQGIEGAGKVAPMHVGGRRLIIMPPSLGYGAASPSGSGIPANASLVFIVDLQKAG